MKFTTTIPLCLLLAACAGSDSDTTDAVDTDVTDTDVPDDTDTPNDTEEPSMDVPDVYDFAGRNGKESSVSYGGQTFRHLLIADLDAYLDGLTADLVGGFTPDAGDIDAAIRYYIDFDPKTSLGDSLLFEPSAAPALQATFGDVGSGTSLRAKIAGNDAVGQHIDWNTDGIVGWPGGPSPTVLVEDWADAIDAASVAWADGTYALDPSGAPVESVLVTASGLDYGQLMQKFLLGAIGFSQGADDYLDDDTKGKGLLASHVAAKGAKYTGLEHAWDEGYGYFGGARDFPLWTESEVTSEDSRDSMVADGKIDLATEMSWGHSRNTAKRDADAVVASNFRETATNAFFEGRTFLAGIEGELTMEQMDELKGYRDLALGAWEDAIAASAVHYINDTLADMDAIGTTDYDFGGHAKHWSEMKGFALSLQFNRMSPMTRTQHADLHALLGDAPVLEGGDLAAYEADLLAARTLIGEAFGFDPQNLEVW